MLDHSLVSFVIAAAVLIVTPGADTMLVLRNTIAHGGKAGVITSVGICAGLLGHSTLAAVGLSAILMNSATAFNIVKYAGACFLGLLGVQSLYRVAIHEASKKTTDNEQPDSTRPSSAPLVQGLLSNLLNPKCGLFYLAFLPQFISPSDPFLSKLLLLAGIHFVMSIVWLLCLTRLAHTARVMFARSGFRRWMDGVSGAVLIGLGARLALSER